jgi:hypothetical protein
LSRGTFSAEYLEKLSWTKFKNIKEQALKLNKKEQTEIDEING